MPVPSQETEEWRYTDLSDFELDFRPYSEGLTATDLHEVPDELRPRRARVRTAPDC